MATSSQGFTFLLFISGDGMVEEQHLHFLYSLGTDLVPQLRQLDKPQNSPQYQNEMLQGQVLMSQGKNMFVIMWNVMEHETRAVW